MKKLSLVLVVLLVAALVLAGCGTKTPDTPVTPLIMATEAGFAPYEYLDGTEIVGVDVDIAREIAAELGRELVISDMAFDVIIDAVRAGKADFGAAGMSITEERAELVDFSIEYAVSKQVLVVLADSDYTGPADFVGKIVAAQEGTVAHFYAADEIDDLTVLPCKKYFEAVNHLRTGRVDAIVMDVLPALELVRLNEGLVILDEELFTDSYAFCVNKGNTELLAVINRVMQRLLDAGKIDEYTLKHLG
ncbi:MAG: ABC transporter substrate-binding protein [Clostridiales bacterium]|nr:ABC transporter substrate-binding protein [Clostridiales bacterium]